MAGLTERGNEQRRSAKGGKFLGKFRVCQTLRIRCSKFQCAKNFYQKNLAIEISWEVRQVGVELFHTSRRTDGRTV